MSDKQTRRLEIKCDLLFTEEGMHPDGIYVDQGEDVEVYYELPLLANLLHEQLAAINYPGMSAHARINNLCIVIEQGV